MRLTTTALWGVLKPYVITAAVTLVVVAGIWAAQPISSAQFYSVLMAVTVLCSLFLGGRAGYFSVAFAAFLLLVFVLQGPGVSITDPGEALGLLCYVTCALAAVIAASRVREGRALEHAGRLRAERDAAANATLLSEFSHRLLNDLNSLVLIASLQSTGASAETRAACRAIADRIQVVGRIYQRLQVRRGAETAIDLAEFVKALCEDFSQAHLALRPVSLRVRTEAVHLRFSRSVLVGLILNEVLTNAAKYAFPDDRAGTVSVHLQCLSDAQAIVLSVEDDGSGLGEGASKGTGLGNRLIGAMTSQLGGSFVLERRGAVTVAELRLPFDAREA